MAEERQQLKLHDLAPAPGSKRDPIRVGRGRSGRRGKTAGRGTKGLKARNTLRPGFEGGQTPLARRLPKLRGFTNPNKEVFAVINLSTLDEQFKAGSKITPEELRSLGLVKHRGRVKILGDGEITKKLQVTTHFISASAKAKIEAAGGTVTIIEA